MPQQFGYHKIVLKHFLTVYGIKFKVKIILNIMITETCDFLNGRCEHSECKTNFQFQAWSNMSIEMVFLITSLG